MTTQRFEHGEHFFWFAKENRVNCREIGTVARSIAKQYQDDTGKSPKYIEHIVCNCYMAWLYNQSVAYFSKNEYWTEYNSSIKSRKDKFSVIAFRSEIRYAEEQGLITTIKGRKYDNNPNWSMASRMIPTEALEVYFDAAWEVAIEYTAETIRFKKHSEDDSKTLAECAKDNTVPVPITEVLERKDFMEKYNNYLRRQYCTYRDTITHYLWDKEHKTTVMCCEEGDVRFIPQLTSNYIGDWEHGGRMYAHSVFGMVDYQQLSKKERSTIKINGENTVEVDYSCLHLSLLYALNHKQLKGDAYGWHEDRKLAKMVTIITLNSRNKYSAASAIFAHLNSDEYTISLEEIKTLVDRMCRYHHEINDRLFRFGVPTSPKLQNHDSNIMCNVLKALYKRNIPALPVHDSVIVPEKYKKSAIRIMKEQYKDYTQFDIEVK